MSDYSELYQQVILEHNKNPRNFRVVDQADQFALGKNPLCGDQFAVYLTLDGEGRIEDIGFQGDGCAIAKASASLMTTQVKGKTVEEVTQLKDEFQQMVTGQLDVSDKSQHHLGKLTLFAGVKEYPVRVKCATLAWHTLAAALSGSQQEVSTEE